MPVITTFSFVCSFRSGAFSFLELIFVGKFQFCCLPFFVEACLSSLVWNCLFFRDGLSVSRNCVALKSKFQSRSSLSAEFNYRQNREVL